MKVQIANTWLIPTLPLSTMPTKQRFVSKVFISKTRKGGLFSFEALRNQVSRIKYSVLFQFQVLYDFTKVFAKIIESFSLSDDVVE